MTRKALGKAHREGISIIELTEMFPDETSAIKWFEDTRWPDGERHCGHCGSTETKEVPNAKPMPYWCKACRSYFSVRTGSMLQSSRLPLRKWVFAVYLYVTNLKGVSSMKLHRDLKVTQKTAWFMLHRLRQAWAEDFGADPFDGPVEADETYIGGKRKNMSKAKRKELTGRGAVGKAAVVGTKDRESNKVAARHVQRTSSARPAHVQHTDAPHVAGFVTEKTKIGAKVYTDEGAAYNVLGPYFDHERVNHSAGEYVREQAHINGMESFWSMLKRGYQGTYHKMSPKQLDRYVNEFSGRHNVRDADTIDQMETAFTHMIGKHLAYRSLIADNGLSSGARSA